MVQLSKRLETIANMIPRGSRLADIGSDHALLPVYTMEAGIAVSAVAGEVNEGPYQAASKQVKEAGLLEVISVRLGYGLEVIAPGEIDTIVIAGMGGALITEILSRGAADGKLDRVRRLVLQPNIGERLVREWCLSNGWKLTQEQLLEEDGIAYEILYAEASVSSDRSDADQYNEELYARELPHCGRIPKELRLLMGPLLLTSPTPLFMDKWSAYAAKLERMIEQIGKSASPEALAKRESFRQEHQGVKEVLECLSAYEIS